ncbi:serine-type endopeptidase inhibitor activity protein [Homalodisca vitripennis]|nr:serine-type endopeptidase inhibitor activity protein [Homalodisca vitripennis]
MGSSADQIWLLVGSYYFSCPLRSDGQRCCPLWHLRAHSSHVIVASPPARIYFQRVNDTVPFKKLNGFKGPKEERFFMVIVLPFKKDGIKQLDLDSSRLVFPALIQKMKLLEVNLTMPRFSIEFETKLSSVLQEMGLNEVFSPKAKLPYIFNNKQGKISAMIHKAVMEVTEKGTKAAAGSGASVVPLMHGLDSISLELNRPFYYFVCEADSQAILFMGRLSTMEETGDQERAGPGPDSTLESLQSNNQLTTSSNQRVPPQPANKPNLQINPTAHVSHGALNYPYDPAQSSSTTRRYKYPIYFI